VPLLGDTMTASGIGLERHGGYPRSGRARPPMPSSLGRQIAHPCNKAALRYLRLSHRSWPFELSSLIAFPGRSSRKDAPSDLPRGLRT
jgi:hypothetical protein